jgi:hypothetical protein
MVKTVLFSEFVDKLLYSYRPKTGSCTNEILRALLKLQEIEPPEEAVTFVIV